MRIFLLFVTVTQVVLLAAQNKYCNNANQCVGKAWILSPDQNIYGNGYKSLSGPSTLIINNYNNTYCYGAYACTEISFILSQSDVYCEGIGSCSNIFGYIDAPYVACRGSHSCSNSTITSLSSDPSSYIYCYGAQSCNYANISSRVVYADGAYSMYGSTIDSNNSQGLTVFLLGYQAGFGAKIICRSGDICNIYCYTNGCQMLFVVCEDANNCNIVLNSNAVSQPIKNMADYDDNLYDTKYIMHYKTDQLCNGPSNQFIFDDYRQYKSAVYIDNGTGPGPVCCRGTESCKYAATIQFAADEATNILICSATMSCREIDITMTGTLFCEGFASCLYANINGADNVYCLGGSNSCGSTVIKRSKNVYCVGGYSCQWNRIESDGVALNVYLLGRSAAYESGIYCGVGDECVIVCGGYHSCVKTTLFCNDNCLVYCNNTLVAGCPVGNYTLTQTAIPTKNPTSLPLPTYISPSTATTLHLTSTLQSTSTIPPPIQLSTNVYSTYGEPIIILVVILTVLIVGMFAALMKMRQNINNINKKQDVIIDALPQSVVNNANMSAKQNDEEVASIIMYDGNPPINKEEKMGEAMQFGTEKQEINLWHLSDSELVNVHMS